MPADGLVAIRRLHRLVRHGYRPWLGYDVASGQDRAIELHDRRSVATIHPDGTVVFSGDGPAPMQAGAIAGDDAAGFDAVFPPNAPNKRNLMRRLYEMGL